MAKESNVVKDSREVGLDPDRLNRLAAVIEEDTEQGLYDGAVFVVGRRGKIAMHKALGFSDLENKRTAKIDDVFHLFSISKQLSAVAVLMAIEQGKFTLTTKVKEVITEFGIKGKDNITVWHLLTHTSGINNQFPFMFPVDKVGVISELVAAVSQEPLQFSPGKIMTYNALTAHSILAEMVCRLDEKKRPFRRILHEDLFAPLGMTDTSLGIRKDLADRRVPVAVRDTTPGLFDPLLLESMNTLITEETEFPAGGAVSTAVDIYRFAEMLRRGGELDGARILSPETIKLATTNQTGTMVNHIFDYMREMRGLPEWPAYIGLTFFLRGEGVFLSPLGVATSPETFAGLGAGSTVFWVDPVRELVFVCLTAGLIEEGASFMRFQRLSDMVVAAVVD